MKTKTYTNDPNETYMEVEDANKLGIARSDLWGGPISSDNPSSTKGPSGTASGATVPEPQCVVQPTPPTADNWGLRKMINQIETTIKPPERPSPTPRVAITTPEAWKVELEEMSRHCTPEYM